MERHAEQAALAASSNSLPDIQERGVEQAFAVEDQDPAGLLGDEQASRTVTRMRDRRRTRDTAEDFDEVQLVQVDLGGRRRNRDKGQERRGEESLDGIEQDSRACFEQSALYGLRMQPGRSS